MCVQGRAAVPEGHVSVASAACEHEERGVLALPAQRHPDRLRMEPGHGEAPLPWGFVVFSPILMSLLAVLTLPLCVSPVRCVVSLLQSGSRSWITWSPRCQTSCLTAKRASCSRQEKDESWRRRSSRPRRTARTCCSTWRPVRLIHTFTQVQCTHNILYSGIC